jgi:hypothetical protein
VILLPVDACPRCLAAAVQTVVHPNVVLPASTTGIFADYVCPACHHQWYTGWAADATTTPCPGCPGCAAQKGEAA